MHVQIGNAEGPMLTLSQKECFFLHAKAHSSGLNLVNATHVFLCEPLINTAIELQYVPSEPICHFFKQILSLGRLYC